MNTLKNSRALFSLLFIAAFALAVTYLYAAPERDVREPILDSQGRFWVYRNGPTHPPMPFTPYGWMSDATNLTQILKVETNCRDHPHVAEKSAGLAESEECLRVKVAWKEATWVSVAFISGPAKPPWWGDTDRGRYFNLSSLPKKKLVFFARGEHGGENIQAQIGVLGDKPFGDSMPKPVISEEIKLTKDWEQHEIDLKDVSPSDLARICSGFGIIVERATQPGTEPETQFYLDDIYFE